MRDWWNSTTAAWGFLIIEIGGGIVLTYLSPAAGIPIGLILVGFGIWLLIRAYRRKPPSTIKQDEKLSLTELVKDVLAKTHKRDLKLKDKCVRQYLALFRGADFKSFLDLFANAQNGYEGMSKDIRKDIGKKKLSGDMVKKRRQIDELAEKVMSSTVIDKDWTLDEIVRVGNLIDRLPNEQNPKYRGIRSLRKTDKKWNKLFENLQNIKVKYPDIFSDAELKVMVNDYPEWSFAGSSLLILVDLLNKFALGLLPTEYISSGTYDPYEKIENRMTRLLEDIANKIHSINDEQKVDIAMSNTNEDKKVEEKPTIIKDSEVKLNAKDTEEATGMDISTPTKLDNVKVDMTAENVRRATGLNVTAVNKEFALGGRTIVCSCGHTFSSVTTHGYRPVIKCTKCGKEYRD